MAHSRLPVFLSTEYVREYRDRTGCVSLRMERRQDRLASWRQDRTDRLLGTGQDKTDRLLESEKDKTDGILGKGKGKYADRLPSTVHDRSATEELRHN